MAVVKSLTNVSRWRLGSAAHICPVSLCIFPKLFPHLENCTKNARNLSQGPHPPQTLLSNSSSPVHQLPPHLAGDGQLEHRMPAFRSDSVVPSLQENPDRQYVCPSRLSHLFSQVVITDKVSHIQSFYHCPIPAHSDVEKFIPGSCRGNHELVEPDQQSGRRPPCKEAKQIMRIRHKKMKRHKLKKLRKRMYFLWRKQKATRRAKRDAIYWQEINDIKKQATDFDAETFIKEQLDKARKGGFYIDVMGSK